MSRVLHIGKFYPPFAGGMENFLRDLLEQQNHQKGQAAALVHEHRRSWHPWPPLQADNGLIYRAPCYGRLLYAPVSPHFPFWLHQSIRQFKPQLLHLHLPNTSAFWALFSPLARQLPWVIHWHSDVVASEWDRRLTPAYRLYRPFEQALLKRSQAIIATSPPYLESSAALQNWREKCHIIPLGIDPQRLAQASPGHLKWAEQQWGQTRLRVLSVGRLTYYKGHEFLLDAIAQVADSKAVIVGQGEKERHLRRKLENNALQQRVLLAGYCDSAQLAALFATCDVFCLPSLERTEAFGVVLMEAMYYGKAIIASNIPGSGVTWVVQDGMNGLLARSADSGALAQALCRLRDGTELARTLGKTGKRRFEQEFHIKQVAEQHERLYQKILV